MDTPVLDEIDRRIINGLQGGFPLSERPYADAAAALGLDEDALLMRLQRLVGQGVLSRFGPLYNVERMGGSLVLAAMRVPAPRLEQVAAQVNAHPEVAHNYARDHEFNLWFVISALDTAAVRDLIRTIEQETGLRVYSFPKRREFFIGLRLEA